MMPSYLDSFVNFESNLHQIPSTSFNIQRMQSLLNTLDNPQEKLRFIHVAGTKGKGSTCAMIAYILRAAGYRVGLYTSPHLYRVNERIRVLTPSMKDLNRDFGGMICDGEFKSLITKFKSGVERVRHDKKLGNATYFEVLTGLALCYFVKKKVDIVILETGLGGRLDATNAVDAIVNVITPISLDHTQLLGKTLGKIAAEKAAIIKYPQSSVVVAPQPSQALAVIRKRCRSLGISPIVIGKKTATFKTPLAGAYQIENAATAVAVVESLAKFGFKVNAKAVARGINETRWPGRFEIIHKSPTVIVDCAHNPASAAVLVKTFQQLYPGKKAFLILGLSQDKDIAGICRELVKIARVIILTKSNHPRAFDFKASDQKKLFKNKRAVVCPSVKEALRATLQSVGRQDMILAAGSVFVAAEVREAIKHVSA